MDGKEQINQIVIAIGHPVRISMLILLMEGRALTAKELAYGSGTLPAIATHHLQQLTKAGLVNVIPQGRFKYFFIARPEVASVVESLMFLSSVKKKSRNLPNDNLCSARFCYDHLAGRLGVRIYQSFLEKRFIIASDETKNLNITSAGYAWLIAAGLDADSINRGSRKRAFKCLDWSERLPHIGGALGVLVADFFLKNNWIERQSGTRAITVTELGKRKLLNQMDIDFE